MINPQLTGMSSLNQHQRESQAPQLHQVPVPSCSASYELQPTKRKYTKRGPYNKRAKKPRVEEPKKQELIFLGSDEEDYNVSINCY